MPILSICIWQTGMYCGMYCGMYLACICLFYNLIHTLYIILMQYTNEDWYVLNTYLFILNTCWSVFNTYHQHIPQYTPQYMPIHCENIGMYCVTVHANTYMKQSLRSEWILDTKQDH